MVIQRTGEETQNRTVQSTKIGGTRLLYLVKHSCASQLAGVKTPIWLLEGINNGARLADRLLLAFE